MKYIKAISLFFILVNFSLSAQDGFTQSDRERMIRTEVTLQEYIKSNDKRMEELNISLSKRMEETNISLSKRIEETNASLSNRIQDMNNLLTTVIYIFLAVSGGVFVYIIWDRKTFMNTALQNAKVMVDSELASLQQDGKLNDLIKAMRELAQDDPKVKSVLVKFRLI